MSRLTTQLKILTFFLCVITLLTEFVLPTLIDIQAYRLILPLPVLILFSILLLYASGSFDSMFLYSFELLLFSAVILLCIYLSKNSTLYLYNQSYLFVLLYNWLIPMICSIVVNLHDKNHRFSHFKSYFKKTSLQFILYYIVFITLVLVIDPIEIPCSSQTLYTSIHQIPANNIIPFYSIASYVEDSLEHQTSFLPLIQYLLAATLIMVPYGFYTTLLFKQKGHFLRLLILLLLPITMELLNYFVIKNNYDIEHIFLGLLGGFVGASLYFLINARYNSVRNSDFLE